MDGPANTVLKPPKSKVDGPAKTVLKPPKIKMDGPAKTVLKPPKSKSDGPTKTVLKPPKSKADASSNWKQLSTVLPSTSTTKRERAPRWQKRNKNKSADSTKPKHESKSEPKDPKNEPKDEPAGEKKTDVLVRPKTPTQQQVITNEFGYPAYDKDGKCLTPGPLPWGLMHHTKAIAIDCEMVGVGPNGVESALARIALVNESGFCVYHKFVKPKLPVTDYRTHVSGIRPEDLVNGEDIHTVMKEVSDILRGHVLVGHGVSSDLKVLFLRHPRNATRDTAFYFKHGYRPKLSKLVLEHLGVTIQNGEHSPIEDAQAVMKLYLKFKAEWEQSLKYRAGRH